MALWCLENLIIAEKLPAELKSTTKYKELVNLFTKRILFLEEQATFPHNRPLPPILENVTESDFKDQYQLKLRYCEITGLKPPE